ncbi:hypothetical protein GCM10025771_33620 [Niveibacterium umoris]|uniref:ABC-type uncharacterized transport system auxiliary subunit n=1 Tax=Niveibacterium umoris TaxID=1193620 RepID=A0A840BEB2_9RHOO|nr:hypothetical protein [Niveibacterium umoris]MBB4011445.1 ABC-type uncharacterized transport system auxiliary subunit [Niveibacterium umoris]
MYRIFLTALSISLIALASGCVSRPGETGAAIVHDLGLPATPGSAMSPLPLRRVEVIGAPALSGLAMQYRYAEDQTTRRLSYADNRWSATPAQLVESQLARMLSGAAGVGRCKLTVKLDEFVQVFARDGSSIGYAAGSMVLGGERADEVLAQKAFEIRNAATSADPSAGALALRGATERIAKDAATWLAAQDAKRCTPG